MGFLKKDSVLKEMSKAEFLILPSLSYEGFPITIIEAFSMSLPVIAPNLGPLKDIINHNKTGLLYNVKNKDDLKNKIQYLIDNKKKCQELGRKARKYFEEKLSEEGNYFQLMKIYESVINEKNK